MRTPAEERERDLWMLAELLQFAVGREGLSAKESEAFLDMHDQLFTKYMVLSPARRQWIENVCDRLCVNKTPLGQRKPVPAGRDVPLAEVLRDLPKRPPGMQR